MKTLLVAAALFASSSLAWLPSCAWNDCMGSWDGSSCASGSGWSCLCSNQTAISQINTCVATSCTNSSDQEAIYGAIAQLCANNGVTVTNSQQATFSATSGGSAWPSQITDGPRGFPGFGSPQWSSWVSACSTALPGAPSGWGSGPWSDHHGWAGHGGDNDDDHDGWGGPWGGRGGPWGTKASGVNCDSWTTWTAGWGPWSSWTGTWSGCSTTTAAPSPATVTTTLTTGGSTQVVTGTTFGIQAVAAATSGSTAGSGSSTTGDNGALSAHGVSAMGALTAAIFVAMIIL